MWSSQLLWIIDKKTKFANCPFSSTVLGQWVKRTYRDENYNITTCWKIVSAHAFFLEVTTYFKGLKYIISTEIENEKNCPISLFHLQVYIVSNWLCTKRPLFLSLRVARRTKCLALRERASKVVWYDKRMISSNHQNLVKTSIVVLLYTKFASAKTK